MATLTKQQILAADDRKPICVPCPEWGGDVYVRPLGGDERDRYDQVVNEKRWPDEGDPDWRGIRAALLALTLCDADGELLRFSEHETAQLGQKSAVALDRCYAAARDASGLGVNAIEDAAKNSSGGQSENSG